MENSDKQQKGFFVCFAQQTAAWSGKPAIFMLAAATVVVWGLTGPLFGFSDTWQLVINTGTTIITFLMVFLIQNTQNRDSRSLHLKLDELIRATEGAHTVLLNIEELSDEELSVISEKYRSIGELAHKRMRKGKQDTNIPEIILDQPLDLKKRPAKPA